ncbi:hypothetical protein HED54_14815 [Ochrobactrum anthropi ATCC 49188]|nr:hypothetical protein [Brucella anthropi ATCC 49188]
MSAAQKRIADLDEDELISLADAVEIFFSGRLTKSSLRTEAAKETSKSSASQTRIFVTRNGIR